MKTYRTSIILTIADSREEREHDLTLEYKITPGSSDYWDGQMWQQGWDAEVELHSGKVLIGTDWIALPEWLFGMFYGDEDLKAALLHDAADADEYARDQKADADREERMLERGK